MNNKALYKVAETLRARLALWKKMAEQTKDRGEEALVLAPEEIWEKADQAALDAFDALIDQSQGRMSLPFPAPASATHPKEVTQ